MLLLTRNRLIALIVLVLLTGLSTYYARQSNLHRQEKHIQIQAKEQQIKELETKQQEILHQKATTEAEKQQQAEQIKQLEAEKATLLQAKKEREEAAKHAAKVNPFATQKVSAATPPPAPSGSGCEWLKGRLAANGVASGDIPAAIAIAQRESGCNPMAVNKDSGACNVFQELACGKWGGRYNVDAHIQGASKYARDRYGGWWGAYNAWQRQHWW